MSEALLADLTPAQNDLFKKATQATERKNTDFAITLLRQLLSQTPGHIESRRLLRSNEIIKFRAANALSRSMSGMKIAPMTIKGKGLVNKNPVEALDVAENILELDPFHEQGNTILADAGKALGSNDIALLALETVREGDPKNTNNMKRLALLHLEMGDPEKAVQIYDKIIAVTPNDGEAIKGQKDAAAAMAAKAGKWDQEGSFRNQLKNADEARLLEQSAREVTSEEGIDMQLHELYQLFE
ncbi:MAG: tetratricopeptide repeat protein, partial [Verrucomicrobiota bacterium]